MLWKLKDGVPPDTNIQRVVVPLSVDVGGDYFVVCSSHTEPFKFRTQKELDAWCDEHIDEAAMEAFVKDFEGWKAAKKPDEVGK